ncbi:WG repeat-containing protein [Winogradskyella sp.]|uniref:WG repeat-containing protein n=1 Tax=uncultured Winogradskyella sp. TaxID=395353 RepID=UPI00236D13C0|nr:WG repeat-containing protein [Winogradskyella sp.]MDC0006760.1 WG repeat-containing protein [Winogradskyella sp.]MDC1504099.1 WG repeat-containing protein [Winogradskyella sp.]|tara:strand:- start:14247 stop:14858 length:612 start_codon:yes stop_codon:yes gene_type:complete
MKKATLLFLIFIIIPLFTQAQSVTNMDYVSPVHNDVAAIKKDGKWAFINTEGRIIINFRDDLVATKTESDTYPIFYNDRCKIVVVKDGISYFGFINNIGETVIKPQFLNVTNFNNGNAIALEVTKKVIAKNSALGKDIVNYSYYKVLINTDGEVTDYLSHGINIVLDKDFLKAAPQINTKRITEHLYAVKNKKNLWDIINIKD